MTVYAVLAAEAIKMSRLDWRVDVLYLYLCGAAEMYDCLLYYWQEFLLVYG